MGAIGKLAAIEPHPKRRSYYHLLIEGHEALLVHEDVVVELGLRAGSEVTPELLEAIVQRQEVSDAHEKALRLLETRGRSRYELDRALRQRGVAAEAADEALAKLENLGLVNDVQFARDLAASLLRRHVYGRQGLRYRLRQSGVAAEVAEDAVNEVLEGADETERAVEALSERQRAWRSLPPEKRRARAYQHLARLGFDGDAIVDALNTASADE